MRAFTHLKAGSWSGTHHVLLTAGRTRWQPLLPGVRWGIDVWWVHQLPGKPGEKPTLKISLIKAITRWPGGNISRKVSQVSRVQVKHCLVEQAGCRAQQNSHLDWPDHTHRHLQPKCPKPVFYSLPNCVLPDQLSQQQCNHEVTQTSKLSSFLIFTSSLTILS